MSELTKHPVVEPKREPAAKPSAGASGDPAVHQALAELQTALMNRDAAEAAVANAKKSLAELGYE